MADPQGILARFGAAARFALTGAMPAGWFGPMTPIAPQAPEEVRGRGWDYPTGYNVQYMPRAAEPVGFAKLRHLADASDHLRLVMERQKDLVEAVEWRIKPKDDRDKKLAEDPAIAAITEAFQKPDRIHDWSQWVRALLEENYVIDAVSIYARPTRGGGLWSLDLLDGSTIKPLLDQSGRAPFAPDAAYQQVLKGLPAVNYTPDELLYYPQNWRVHRAYGFSKVEQIIRVAETSIERMKSQLAYFKYGNIQDGYFTGPEGYSSEQISAIETHWNDLMGSSVEARRRATMLPNGFEWHETKKDVLADAFDEWLIRLICFVFGTSPTPFLKQAGLGQGSANSDKESAEEGGLAPTLQYVRRVMNRILRDFLGRGDLEFAWIEDREFDPKTAAEIEDIKLGNGTTTINEVRDRAGETPIEGGNEPLLKAGNTWLRLRDVLNPPEPPAPTVLPGLPGGPAMDAPSADAEPDETKAALEKAAKANAALNTILRDYLQGKADECAAVMPALLGAFRKAAEDDYRGDAWDRAFEAADWTWSDLPKMVEPVLAGIAATAGKKAVNALNLFDDSVIEAMTERATTWAEARAAELIGKRWVDGELVDNGAWSIAQTTRDMLRGTVVEALERGDSNDELADAIRDSTAFSEARAENIARTETAIADVKGQIAGWRESGLVTGKRWLAASDCCDECQELDGETVGIEDEFVNGDPPLHPSCRCDVVPVLEGEDGDDASADDQSEEE